MPCLTLARWVPCSQHPPHQPPPPPDPKTSPSTGVRRSQRGTTIPLVPIPAASRTGSGTASCPRCCGSHPGVLPPHALGLCSSPRCRAAVCTRAGGAPCRRPREFACGLVCFSAPRARPTPLPDDFTPGSLREGFASSKTFSLPPLSCPGGGGEEPGQAPRLLPLAASSRGWLLAGGLAPHPWSHSLEGRLGAHPLSPLLCRRPSVRPSPPATWPRPRPWSSAGRR